MIADMLKKMRESKKLTQQDVADGINVNSSTYKNYEYGRREPDLETVSKLADFYGVTTDYLLGREPLPNPFAELNLSNDDEAAVMEKFMSLPDSFRACALELLRELGGAVKGNESVQPNAQEQIQKSDTYNSELAIARSSNSNFLNVPDEETEKTFTVIEPDPDF